MNKCAAILQAGEHLTDTAALAAAIADFESEFPEIIWGVGKDYGALAMQGFQLVAISYERCPAAAMRGCIQKMRERRLASADEARMTAE